MFARNILKLLFLLIFLTLTESNSWAQTKYNYLTNANEEEVDTLALETSKDILEGSAGLLEKEIDPETYLMGPNDELMITIISFNPMTYKQKVTPEGMLVIPQIGAVELKGKTLSEAKVLIEEKIRTNLQTQEVYIALNKLREFKVTVNGAIRKSSMVAATAADRVNEIVDKAGGLIEESSLRNIVLMRDQGKQVINVDLMKYFRSGDKDACPTVLGGDHIIIPPYDKSGNIFIYGEVAVPDSFEFRKGDKLSDLFRFALGFKASAFLDSVEVARIGGSGSGTESIYLDLSSWKTAFYTYEDLENDIELRPGDRVYVQKAFDDTKLQTVAVMGEVKYPGYYPIKEKSVRLTDLISKAGGLSLEASINSAVLIRQKEFLIKDEEMDRLRSIPAVERSEDEERYYRARQYERKGVMAIDLELALRDPDIEDNIYLEDLDSLFIPKKKTFINVQGRVNKPGLVIYNSNFTFMDYIAKAGGYGFRADDGETMVVKSKGQQFDAESGDYILEPGDNILVPPKEDISWGVIIQDGFAIFAQLITVVGVIVSLSK